MICGKKEERKALIFNSIISGFNSKETGKSKLTSCVLCSCTRTVTPVVQYNRHIGIYGVNYWSHIEHLSHIWSKLVTCSKRKIIHRSMSHNLFFTHTHTCIHICTYTCTHAITLPHRIFLFLTNRAPEECAALYGSGRPSHWRCWPGVATLPIRQIQAYEGRRCANCNSHDNDDTDGW